MPKISKITAAVPKLTPKKRVAAYARVSMESENLLHSLSAQVSHYSNMIQKNPEWIYAGVFADSGITGTETESRREFNRLLDECDAGKIDVVLVKSISRFARNTVDTLRTVRHLRDIGVEVRFERENISTFSGDGELLLTILASYAQEESRSISDNVKWATRKRFEQGIPNGHKAPFGYFWDGEMYRIIPEQAEAVRLIFNLYLDGDTPFQIRDEMRRRGIKSQSGAEMTDGTIKDIISNISYTGTMILQKNYINDSHRRIINKGELPKYAVDDMYEPIITGNEFDKAQEIRKARAEVCEKDIRLTCFSGRMKCGGCGGGMSRRTANHKKKWVCNRKERKGANECCSKGVYEEDLKNAAADAMGGTLEEDAFKNKVQEVRVFDDRIEFHFKERKKVTKQRTYKGKRRGGFSGRLFCGCCGSPVHRETVTVSIGGVRQDKVFRRCRAERRHECSLPLLYEENLLKACHDVLGETDDPETAFAREIGRLTVYSDRLEFATKEGDVHKWQRE